MPIYEYQCQACRHQLEVLQKISDEPLQVCPACNESALKKLVSAAAFRLKGGGWYETDFKTGDKKKNLAADSGGDGGKGDKSSGASGAGDKGAGDKKAASKESSKASPKAPAAGASSGNSGN